MKFRKLLSLTVAALLVGLVGGPPATAQYYGTNPWYGGYYEDDYYDDDWYYDYYDLADADYGRQTPAAGVRRVLADPYAEWEYDSLTDEWEIESVHGEVDYEPRGPFSPANREQLEQAIRSTLAGAGRWEYEPLEGEWVFETPAGDEVEYESGARIGYYDRNRYYGYRGQSPETGVRRVLEDRSAEWEYEQLGDEWEIESVHGEVDYEPEGYFEPANRAQLERAIRQELQEPGEWQYEPLEGEWEYETPTGDEVEYEPGTR